MSLLDKASLIVTPNGYSEDTLYSVVPSSGAGDLSFTRATDAWRTNSSGLVQRVCWNLVQYSEQFENAAWTLLASSVTVNSTTSPSGVTDAYTLTGNGTLNIHAITQAGNSTNGVTYTHSIYAKKNTNDFIQLVGTGSIYTSSTVYANFDLNNGVVGLVGAGTIATIQNIGNGWYRCTMTATATATTSGSFIYPCLITSATSARGEANTLSTSVFLWGAQLTEGSSALEYFPTTDRQNVPRIDYSLGGCPTLLMEPQRTNIVLRSEEFDNVYWSKNTATVISNNAIAPNGTLTADKIFPNSTGSVRGVFVAGYPVNTYNFSVFAKADGKNFLYFYVIGSTANTGVWFNLSNGTIETIGTAWTSVVITNVGNGWYRCSANVSLISASNNLYYFISDANNDINVTANGSDGILLWGAQLEVGAYPTSYIPTTTASVTRNADLATKLGISSLLGQTEGTVFYEMSIPRPNGLGNQVFSHIANDAGSFFYYAYVNNTGNIVFDIYAASGIYTFTLITSAPMVVGRNRVALVYKAGAYKVFLNGVLVATSTNSTPITNTLSRLTLTVNVTPIYYYEFIAFKSALSDAELELLTGDSFDSYAKMAAYFNYTLQ
jgi:hypothetical protein